MIGNLKAGVDRRSFLAGASALALTGAHASHAQAQAPLLTVATRQIEVKRRGATVYGVSGADGRLGHFASEGDSFAGEILNRTSEPLVMHWHGQIYAAEEQDRSRPDGGAIASGASDTHSFRLTPGTHWMHAHQLSEQQLLAAPMITRDKDAGDIQDVVIMLHDFAFRSPTEILAELGGASAHGGHGLQVQPPARTSGMSHGMMHGSGMRHGGHGAGMVHANDVRYDAYLANDRTLDDPEVIRVERGASVRLRIINGATASAFFIDTGALESSCIAVDGSSCQPMTGRRFPLAQGQRIDLAVTIPADGGVFPILAQVEAATMRTGIILATPGASVARIPDTAAVAAPHTDLSLDAALTARVPLPARRADRVIPMILGEAEGYRWLIDGAVQGRNRPHEFQLGQRVEITFMNPTSMMHPMHLHGHHFQVVGVGSRRFSGPVRDTVIVPPHMPATVAVDLDKRGRWYLHCHHLYHMATGMMTEVVVS